jgi:prepilin-type N-terminal cleavage/methylation domain-containing protein
MTHGTKKTERGFSTIELLVVLGIILILSAIALPQMVTMRQTYEANSAVDSVVGQLRAARETAISRRREIQVSFIGTNQMQMFQFNLPTGSPQTPLTDVPTTLNSGAQFMLFPGEIDTPMAFGNAAPIWINNQNGGPLLMKFSTTGAFVGPTEVPISGTIFIGIPGQPSTARAVTIVGGTGRVRPYSWTGTQWIE